MSYTRMQDEQLDEEVENDQYGYLRDPWYSSEEYRRLRDQANNDLAGIREKREAA